MKQNYICSVCKEKAVVKDPKKPPFLICGCDKGSWVGEKKGGKYTNQTGAKPILSSEEPSPPIEVIRIRRRSKTI